VVEKAAPRIVVLDGHTLNPGDNPWDEIARLGDFVVYDRTTREDVAGRARGADIVLTNKTPIDARAIDALPDLRFVAVLATGYDVVDLAAARARGVAVSNVPEYGTASVAQHVFALLLELSNRICLHAAAVAAGEWTRSPDFSFWKTPIVELAGKKLGVVGLGRIGRRVAEIGRAFGMEVICAGRSPAAGVPSRTVDELFSEADVVSLHCPLTLENRRFVDRDLLRRMKPSAFFINTARGGLVDEEALREALEARWLAGAALDVVSKEPIEPENPLLGAPNLILTPHLAWASLAARRRLMEVTRRNVEAFLAGRPIHVVN
jgi:glycerate dehydrogenase